jgi:hypothetical protein
MKKRTESHLVMAIIKYLNYNGFIAGKLKTTGIMRNGRYCFDKYLFRGVPDILFFKGNRMGFIEAKVATKQNLNQRKFQELCRMAGIEYYVIKSIDDLTGKVLSFGVMKLKPLTYYLEPIEKK